MNETAKFPQHAHRKDLTFRQAEGVDPLPKMLAYGEISETLRLEIWDVLYSFFDGMIDFGGGVYVTSAFKDEAFRPAVWYNREVLRMPLDEAKALSKEPKEFIKNLKQVILKGSYFDCIGSVQFFLRYPNLRQNIKGRLVGALKEPTSPYMAVDMDPWTIIPRGDETERKAFDTNWAIIKASTFEGSKTHLRKSAEALNTGDAAGAIREAIHAVEGAAKVIAGKENATLGDALKVLEKDKGLNSVLKDAFIKLYGYTSSEKGIRHALIDAGNSNVGQDEALFMFSTCTAFVAYLSRKFSDLN